MGGRGAQELLVALPAAAADSARAVVEGLGELMSLRHAALNADEVRVLGEFWQCLSGQVSAGRLGVLAAMDARDDVVPKARAGQASAVYGQQVLGQRRADARRDGSWAQLLRAEAGDLRAVGAAYAAGKVTTAHVEVAVRAHRRLGVVAREALVECDLSTALGFDNDNDGGSEQEELAEALRALSGGFTRAVRQVLVVDAVLAFYARTLAVAELAAVAERIVEVLNPPSLSRAHQRRFLHMSPAPGGGWIGRFECGQAQGLLLKAALAAGSAPRPGRAIDADGVEHDIADTRDLGTRQIDALLDLVKIALAKCGITLPDTDDITDDITDTDTRTAASDSAAAAGDAVGPYPAAPTTPAAGSHPPSGDDHSSGPVRGPGASQDDGQEDSRGAEPGCEAGEEPPPGEGAEVVLRPPGVLSGPYPSVNLTLIAGIEHAAAALTHLGDGLPLDLADAARQALRRRIANRYPLDPDPVAPEPSPEPPADRPGASPGGRSVPPPGGQHRLDWLRHALSPYAVPARLEDAGPVDATTFSLLACSATVRAALLAPGGALLDLGRTQRLASPTQKTALLARDGGCIIPGCTVPGDACDAHHITWWSRGGPTDIDNLALLCDRHHDEVHLGEWEIQMRHGVPWVAPPTWINQFRPFLRNAVHHPSGWASKDARPLSDESGEGRD